MLEPDLKILHFCAEDGDEEYLVLLEGDHESEPDDWGRMGFELRSTVELDSTTGRPIDGLPTEYELWRRR